jgi:DNA-binding MarR family transcriptional regulator
MPGMREPDLARLLLEAHRAVAEEWVANMAERGYPGARAGHAVLALAIDRRTGTRLSDLAERARMTKQGMMLLVDDMEGRGLLRRVPDPEDARAKTVRLTTRGRTYVAESRRTLQAVEGRVRRALGDRRYAQVRDSLEWMAGSEEQEEEP